MKIAYKIRSKSTERNSWIIAVIYDFEGWAGRSLTHKGLDNPQLIREMTDTEKADFIRSGTTRSTFVAYTSVQGFIEDEKLCNVPQETIDNVLSFLKIPNIC
jgi:hypothetical protein